LELIVFTAVGAADVPQCIRQIAEDNIFNNIQELKQLQISRPASR